MAQALVPDQADTISFPDWTPTVRGWLVVECTTKLAGDLDPGDDQKRESLFVRIRDVQTVGVISPATTVDSGDVHVPMVSVRNNGTQAEGFRVRMTIVPGRLCRHGECLCSADAVHTGGFRTLVADAAGL